MQAESTSTSLLERLRQPGHADAWARFVELYTPLLLFWARRAGLHSHDAADRVQDVFVTLVQKLPSFTYDKDKSFRGWLRTVAQNQWRDQMRRKQVKIEPGEADFAGIADGDEKSDAFDAEDQRFLIQRALELMQAEFERNSWLSCWKSVVDGKPAAEVAAELEMTENAVYIAKWHVLRRLRQELRGLLD